MEKQYLKISRASDLKDAKERRIFRALEILPGGLSWLSFAMLIFLSWWKPVWVAVFAFLFVIYWFLRALYFSFHLAVSYRRMKKNEKIDWRLKLDQLPGTQWEDIYHLIIIPVYKEPLQIIKASFESLAKSDYPKNKMMAVLSCEERGGKDAKELASAINKEFKNRFSKLLITFHPSDLRGEMAGKGANETWGAKKAKDLIDSLKIPYEDVIVSSFDADTCVPPRYFSCLTYHYLTQPDPWRVSFQPIPLFTNNIWQASPISRIFAFSATFWQMMCQERPEKMITFSSHSMSFKALVDVDFRQTNVVSDDSRIFWQCFLKYDGDYRIVPLHYPVLMDANVARSFLKTAVNVYRQQRRWAYGVADIPYLFFGFWKNKKIAISKKIYLGILVIDGHWSWATNSIVIFLLGWLPIILGGESFSQTLFSYNLPIFISRVLTIGMAGLIASIYFSIALLPSKPRVYKKSKYLFFILEWLLLPITMVFFGSVPAIDSQSRLMLGRYMGFWTTPKIRK